MEAMFPGVGHSPVRPTHEGARDTSLNAPSAAFSFFETINAGR
jgi:hypothetical protein